MNGSPHEMPETFSQFTANLLIPTHCRLQEQAAFFGIFGSLMDPGTGVWAGDGAALPCVAGMGRADGEVEGDVSGKGKEKKKDKIKGKKREDKGPEGE